jgi:non-homologous end joining protein Ku
MYFLMPHHKKIKINNFVQKIKIKKFGVDDPYHLGV